VWRGIIAAQHSLKGVKDAHIEGIVPYI
jgi:hypothetical protein